MRRVLITHGGITPRIDPSAYVHSSAHVIGDVQLGAESSIWFNAVVRGDVHYIRIGARTNLQDHATVHVTKGRHPTLVGEEVTVGHHAVLHGCTIGNRCLIGIGAIVLDRCAVGDDCLIGAGALLTPGTTIEPGHLVLGSPARVVRPITDAERQHLRQSAAGYVANAARYRAEGIV
jgi:carbonic anhydrase/acetyltransferase-like protein (isoleucine patch superfamily)